MDKKEFEDELEEEQDLPTDSRIQIQMSYGTIRYLIDAIVELVTNSDDSYKRLERKGVEGEGKIMIRTQRLKYDKCEKLEVIDLAEGMDKQKLKESLRFAGEESGFEKGEGVRGFFGRGLKEAILALGKGEIYTIKDDKLSKAILWAEPKGGRHRPPKNSHVPSKEEREGIGIIEGNGTLVRITVTNEKIKCPGYKTSFPQIINHYALRDINSATNRKVTLDFETPEKGGLKYIGKPISYKAPKGKKIVDQSIKLPIYGDDVEIRVYESDEELESPYNNSFARAGLLIKTSDAILDNQLFKYEHEKAGCFFFGEVVWPNLAERLKKGESLVDLNRIGIEWKHKVCQSLQNEIEKSLEPLIEKKKKQIEIKPTTPPSEKIEKLNKDVCSLLNRLAKKHMAELPSGDELSGGEETKIKTLTIKPPYANVEINKERYFSVYAPTNILTSSSRYCEAGISSNNQHIQILDPVVWINPHLKYSNIYYGRFRVIGRLNKEEATITCKLGSHIATAIVRVAPPGKIGKRKEPRGGFFHAIKPDLEENPDQRARYNEDAKIIWIYTKFSGIKRYFEDNLNFKSEESKPMYAELVGEAFCRFIARGDVERGQIPTMPGRDIDAFIRAMNNAQEKYLHLIHEAVLKHKL